MMKKVFAGAMSATLVMGMSLTAFASGAVSDPEASVDAPIFSFDAIDVVVPTTLAVAFNPDGLDVQTGADAADTENSQVLSHKVGILNKSSKDKIVTVTLTVTDKNTYANDDDPRITFVDTASDATGAEKGEYAIYLAAVPADTTEVKVGSTPASASATTTAADLANVAMTAASGKDVALSAGENKIAFKLEKATYGLKADASIELGSDITNDVASKYEVKSLATGGAGITAFTFGGALNQNADWTKLTSGVEIKAVYTFANADGETAITGTGAMVEVAPTSEAPTFTTGSAVGTIDYAPGVGDNALKSIIKVEIDFNNVMYDGYNALSNTWEAATDANGTITFDNRYIEIYANKYTGDATREATITYVNEKDEEKTVTVDVKLR